MSVLHSPHEPPNLDAAREQLRHDGYGTGVYVRGFRVAAAKTEKEIDFAKITKQHGSGCFILDAKPKQVHFRRPFQIVPVKGL